MAAIAAIAKTCYNKDVYEPAEVCGCGLCIQHATVGDHAMLTTTQDSFLLVDVVAQDRQVLQKLNPSLHVWFYRIAQHHIIAPPPPPLPQVC